MRHPRADWRGPIPNMAGGGITVRGVVLHVMEGTLDGTDAWFHNPQAQASAHFGVGQDGRLFQWVDTNDTAWAEANYNGQYLSIETEGSHDDAGLSDAALAACADVVGWAAQQYGFPLVVTDDPSASGLITHGDLGTTGGGHFDCPGPARSSQRQAIINLAQGDDVTDKDKQDTVDGVHTLMSEFYSNQYFPVLTDIQNRLKAIETKLGMTP